MEPSAQLSLCKNCSSHLTGKYCSECGQKVTGRFNFIYLWQQFRSEIFDLDHGLWFTFKDLNTRPGHTVRSYLDGKTRSYYSPLKYLLLSITLWYLIYILSGMGGDTPLNWKEGYVKSMSANTAVENIDAIGTAFTWLIFENTTLYFLLLIPFLATGMWIFFRDRNIVEHIMTISYLWGHSLLWILLSMIVLIPLTILVPEDASGTIAAICVVSFIIILFLFFTITYRQMMGGTFFRTLIRIVPAIWLGYIIFFATMFAVFLIARKIVG